MTIETFADLYRGVGFQVVVENDEIKLEQGGVRFRVQIDDEWRASINAFFKAKQYSFDEHRRMLSSYKSIEAQLVRIDPSFLSRPDHEYTDGKGGVVRITNSSREFSLALMSTGSTLHPMDFLKRRTLRKVETRKPDKEGFIRMYKFDDLVVSPVTARYIVPRKISKDHLHDRGVKAIKASLFKLSLTLGECWELRESMPPRNSFSAQKQEDPDNIIPKAVYNDDLLKLYKVARSSVFPNQEFLSYYHVLEYHFLRVADEILYTSIKSLINAPSFSASYQNVNKLISTLKKNDNSSDETEMLKAVLKKYVEEEDLIDHIADLEKFAQKSIYTDTKKKIFGEQASIKLDKGHALNSTARVIKLIRNALVHSSDRYNRQDCFLPFSESESIVVDYVPILKFLAERVIFATAESA